ncbi:hypothetical protein [Mycobacterium colombiense]|uniref:hypothetical protein n=1 Tax=Mycobacterium colombiense TaxID=339268 RepID=UPI0007FBA6A5|nr:hypothetical protein [Mycobacterium colombiense]OBJ63272.1 hypothetical protein A5627_08435 [Mycobacterium colombiense]
MPDPEPFSEYKDADPEMRAFIEKLMWRRNAHQWFQNVIQLLGLAVGGVIAILGLCFAYSLVMHGGWQIAGGSAIGTVDLASLAATFVYVGRHNNALPQPPSSGEITGS